MAARSRVVCIIAGSVLLPALFACPAAGQQRTTVQEPTDLRVFLRQQTVRIVATTQSRASASTPWRIKDTRVIRACASPKKWTIVGMAVGAGAGGIGGAIMDDEIRGSPHAGVVALFAAVGAGIGGLIGYSSCR